MDQDSISLRATIFPEECPELYAQLERFLPEHKFRRRFVLIEILRLGCAAFEAAAEQAAIANEKLAKAKKAKKPIKRNKQRTGEPK